MAIDKLPIKPPETRIQQGIPDENPQGSKPVRIPSSITDRLQSFRRWWEE